MNKTQLLHGDDFKEEQTDFEPPVKRVTKKRVIKKQATKKQVHKKRAPRKVTSEWPDEKVFRLISIVEKWPALWNVSCAFYKMATDQIWQQVATELGDDDWTGCRIKWQSLRVSYKVNLDKLQKTRSGQDTDVSHRVRWKFFDAMRFIGSSDSANSNESMLKIILKEEKDVCTPDGEAPSSSAATTTPERRRKRSTIRAFETLPVASTQSQSFGKVFERALNVIRRSDEHTAFGDHIAAELRRLPDDDAQILKRRITCVLVDFWDERASQQPQHLDLDRKQHASQYKK